MQMIDVNKLKPHPRNEEFFDDITGDNWKEFLKSVKTSGVIEPVIATQEYVIVSGHQRVRACKELGIDKVLCDVRVYENEDKIIKEMLETNLRQRGIGNTNAIKLAKCIVELERIYGINHGGDRKSKPNNSVLMNQENLAKQFGMSVDNIQNYKKLLTLIPEFQDAIQEGKISPTIGYKILAKLSKQDQEQLLERVGGNYIASLSQKKAETLVADYKAQYLETIKSKDEEISGLKSRMNEKEKVIEEKNKVIDQNKRSFAETREKIQALMNKPADEKSQMEIKVLKEQNESRQKDIQKLQQDIQNEKSGREELQKKYADIKAKLIDMEQTNTQQRNRYKVRTILNDLIRDTDGAVGRFKLMMKDPGSIDDKYLPDYTSSTADELEKAAKEIRDIGMGKRVIQYEE